MLPAQRAVVQAQRSEGASQRRVAAKPCSSGTNRRRQPPQVRRPAQPLRQHSAQRRGGDVLPVVNVPDGCPSARRCRSVRHIRAYQRQGVRQVGHRNHAAQTSGIRQRQRHTARQATQQQPETAANARPIHQRRTHDGQRQAVPLLRRQQAFLRQRFALRVCADGCPRRVFDHGNFAHLTQHLGRAHEHETAATGRGCRFVQRHRQSAVRRQKLRMRPTASGQATHMENHIGRRGGLRWRFSVSRTNPRDAPAGGGQVPRQMATDEAAAAGHPSAAHRRLVAATGWAITRHTARFT